MTVECRPIWDPSGSVSVRVDRARGELVLRGGGELWQFCLSQERPERLGWSERSAQDGSVAHRAVSVGAVVCACLREWEAEEAVLELSRVAAAQARARGERWRAAARRLEAQVAAGRGGARVCALPFQVLFRHRSGESQEQPLSVSAAAERVGYRTADGRPDTQRLRRRMGLAAHSDIHGERCQRTVGYRTGLALCQAIDVDPVELGL